MKAGDEFQGEKGDWLFVVSAKDYARLLEAAESDDMLITCSTCGAWIDRNDPAYAATEDFEGCWKVATMREQDNHLCRSYRVCERATPTRG